MKKLLKKIQPIFWLGGLIYHRLEQFLGFGKYPKSGIPAKVNVVTFDIVHQRTFNKRH